MEKGVFIIILTANRQYAQLRSNMTRSKKYLYFNNRIMLIMGPKRAQAILYSFFFNTIEVLGEKMYTSAHASSLTSHLLTHSYKQKQKMHLLRKKNPNT